MPAVCEHDCTTDKIYYENGVLRFSLPDGLWVTPRHKDNDTGKVLRTDAAGMIFVWSGNGARIFAAKPQKSLHLNNA